MRYISILFCFLVILSIPAFVNAALLPEINLKIRYDGEIISDETLICYDKPIYGGSYIDDFEDKNYENSKDYRFMMYQGLLRSEYNIFSGCFYCRGECQTRISTPYPTRIAVIYPCYGSNESIVKNITPNLYEADLMLLNHSQWRYKEVILEKDSIRLVDTTPAPISHILLTYFGVALALFIFIIFVLRRGGKK